MRGSWPGAVCERSGGKKANTTGCVRTRTFGSGTKVFSGQFLPPVYRKGHAASLNAGACIYWSDGSVTTANATRCMPKAMIK